MAQVYIRCPQCLWEPDGNPYWQCHCGHVWDTFKTQAKCPACGFRHENTPCIAWAGGCDKTSPHLDWYGGLDQIVDEALEEEQVPLWLRHGDVR